MITIIFIFLFIILLFVPIGARVIYDDTYSDIDIFIFKYIRYKFDLDSFLRKFLVDKNNNGRISLPTIINNLEIMINSRKTIKDIMKTMYVKKSTIILKQDYDNYLLFVFFWNIVSRYTYIIRKSFKNVENEYYMTSANDKDISIELILRFRLINVLLSLLKNTKEMFKVVKIKRRQKNDGTSNM